VRARTTSSKKAAYSRALSDGLRPAALVLSVVFVFLAGWHPLALTADDAAVMTPLALGTAMWGMAVWAALGRWQLPSRWAHPLAAVLCIPVCVNSAVQYGLTHNAHQLTNMLLAVVALGVCLVDPVWVAVVSVAFGGVWAGTLLALGMPGSELRRTAPDLVLAYGVGVMANVLRRRTLLRLLASQEELRVLAETDELTGLLNRRGFLDAAGAQLRAAPVTLCFVDVDNLKTINDAYGHNAGDEALRAVATALRTACPDGLKARLSGDEFAVIVPGHDPAVVLRAFHREVAVQADGRRLPLAVSVGSAVATPGQTLSSLLAAADAAMYGAKASRRGASAIPDQGGPADTGATAATARP
jgi:diguanylate cyclase (GGDEF)-like protein